MHAGKVLLREELNDRTGHARKDRAKGRRICSCHGFDEVKKSKTFMCKGKRITHCYELIVISANGCKSTVNPSTSSNGVGRDRFLRNKLQQLSGKTNPFDSTPFYEVEELNGGEHMPEEQIEIALPLKKQLTLERERRKRAEESAAQA